jgi:hypothetical protein
MNREFRLSRSDISIAEGAGNSGRRKGEITLTNQSPAQLAAAGGFEMTIVALVLMLLSFSTHAQEQERWQRVATFEDTTVDLDTTNVVFGPDFTGRVRLRFTFSKPQPIPGNTKVKFRSVIETTEFLCTQRRHRQFAAQWLDDKGNEVDAVKADPDAQWKNVKVGSVMYKLMTPACELISEKRRNP